MLYLQLSVAYDLTNVGGWVHAASEVDSETHFNDTERQERLNAMKKLHWCLCVTSMSYASEMKFSRSSFC